jgi:hypothetical protein
MIVWISKAAWENKAFDLHPLQAELYLRPMNAFGLRESITDALKF